MWKWLLQSKFTDFAIHVRIGQGKECTSGEGWVQNPNLLDGKNRAHWPLAHFAQESDTKTKSVRWKKWGLHAEGTASRERIRLHHFSGSAHSALIVRSYCAQCTNTYTVVIAQIERNQPAHSVFICFYRPVNSSSTKLISISISCLVCVLLTQYCFSNWEWGQTQLTLFKRSKHPKVFP